jgi:hypothetical protein
MRVAPALAVAMVTACGGAATTPDLAGTADLPPVATAPQPEPSLPSPKPDRERVPVAALARGQVIARRGFDALDLEEPKSLDVASLRRDGWIEMQGRGQGYVAWFGSKLVAEVEVGTEPPYRVYGGAKVPQTHLRPTPAPPPCGTRAIRTRTEVRWGGIEPADWSADALWFQEFEGTFDTRQCRGVAEKGWRVRARAVRPGLLYAYRRPASDEIVLIAPPAEWVSATVPEAEQLQPHVGTLSLVRLPLKRGLTGSALFVLGPTGVDLFDALRESEVDTFSARAQGFRAVALRADVVWAPGEDRPAAMVVDTGLTELPPRAAQPNAPPSPDVQ